MNSPVRIIYLEDDPADVRLVRDALSDDGMCAELNAVDNRADFVAALEKNPDLILSDYVLPGFDGLEALNVCQALCPSRPFLFVSGVLGEELAINTLRCGATDYVLKTRLSRLGTAVRRALSEAEERIRRAEAEDALRRAHDELEQRVKERTVELSTALQKLSVQSEQLRSLASELTLVEQRERLRLAEQIHDGLQQLLVAAQFRLGQVGRGEASDVRLECGEIGRLLDEALTDSRSLTAELSPPILRTGGLLAGLEWLTRWGQEKHHLTVQLVAPATPLPPLPEDLTVLLFQSVRELLFNAVKYAQVEEVAVTLAWNPPGLSLTVADEGAGFHPKGLRGEGGVAGGFGLARIRHRMELLGGCMHIDSAPGRGTRVTLSVLPQLGDKPPATPILRQKTGSQPPRRIAPLVGSPPVRILIVDDHRVVRQALAQLLGTEADLEVIGEAGTGTAAVALARQLAPDVVLMDINMPEMNGIEATRAIHDAFPAMRVIALSMYDRADQQAAMRHAGAVAYVNKSAPAEDLLAAIRATVKRTS
jgi:signal transduction histidine kinase